MLSGSEISNRNIDSRNLSIWESTTTYDSFYLRSTVLTNIYLFSYAMLENELKIKSRIISYLLKVVNESYLSSSATQVYQQKNNMKTRGTSQQERKESPWLVHET